MRYHIFFILWLLVIFVESSFPGTAYPEINIFQADKIVHLGIYGLLGLLCFISLIHQNKFVALYNSAYLWTLIICSFYGATDEFHQLFTPNRTCDFFDWLGDTAGALIAILVIKYWFQKKYELFQKVKF